MPVAGDEGYEKLVICPYDKSHEIRKGRLQFHLEKCRRNFPMSRLVECPFNKSHVVPESEMAFHMQEDCENMSTWQRYTHQSGTSECTVAGLVPVNAATVPDGGECWDDCQTDFSVLQDIHEKLQNAPILRHKQVVSKSERKNFRLQERRKFQDLNYKHEVSTKAESDCASVASVPSNVPLPRPRVQPSIPAKKQDLSKAVAVMNKQFRTLDMNMKSPTAEVPPSETSSMVNGPPSEFALTTSTQRPSSYAAMMKPSTSNAQGNAWMSSQHQRPGSATSNASTPSTAMSMNTALTQRPVNDNSVSRPESSMTNASYDSFVTAPQGAGNRSPSMVSAVSSSVGRTPRPPNSTSGRPSTAQNIASSARVLPHADEGFSQYPIPGLGRGRRAPKGTK